MTKGKATWSAMLRGVARGAYLAATANPSSLRTRAAQSLCARHGHLVRRGLPLDASDDDGWVWWCARCEDDL